MRAVILSLIFAAAGAAQSTCMITLTPSSVNVPPAGGNGMFSIAAYPNCTRTPVSNSSWITVSFGNSSTPFSVGYTVAPNLTIFPRTGTITLAGAVFTINQAAPPCSFTIMPSFASIPTAGGDFSFNVSTTCQWSAASSFPWITVNSPTGMVIGNSMVSYTVAPNSTVQNRNGSISAGNLSFNLTQLGVGCSYTLSPTSFSFTPDGGMGSINLTTNSGCPWTVSNNATWITGVSPNATGPANINFTVAPNTAYTARSAVLTVAGQQILVSQAGLAIAFTADSIVSGASFLGGSVAPGEIVTIFGSGLGPTAGAGLTLTPDGTAITNLLAGTQVFFNGLPAPLIYVSSTQVSAVVPYSIAASGAVSVQVGVNGIRSSVVQVPVASTQPAIFTANTQGTGQGAVLNQDNSPNSATNPAAAGTVLQIFATGGGKVLPLPADGSLALSPPPTSAATFTAKIAGLDAPVLFAGSAPGLVSGVMQINVRVPSGVNPGPAIPLVVYAGGNASASTVTVAIQ